MSELEAFNASELNAFNASELLARGLGIPAAPEVYNPEMLNSFEMRVEIDKVELWGHNNITNPLPGTLIKTMTIVDAIVFDDGLKDHLLETFFFPGSNERLAWMGVAERASGSGFAMTRADPMSGGGVGVSDNWSGVANPATSAHRAVTLVNFASQQSATATGVVITFDGASVGAPSGYQICETHYDDGPAVTPLPLRGIVLDMVSGSNFRISRGRNIIGIEFSDTPGNTPVDLTLQSATWHIHGRIYLEGLT